MPWHKQGPTTKPWFVSSYSAATTRTTWWCPSARVATRTIKSCAQFSPCRKPACCRSIRPALVARSDFTRASRNYSRCSTARSSQSWQMWERWCVLQREPNCSRDKRCYRRICFRTRTSKPRCRQLLYPGLRRPGGLDAQLTVSSPSMERIFQLLFHWRERTSSAKGWLLEQFSRVAIPRSCSAGFMAGGEKKNAPPPSQKFSPSLYGGGSYKAGKKKTPQRLKKKKKPLPPL